MQHHPVAGLLPSIAIWCVFEVDLNSQTARASKSVESFVVLFASEITNLHLTPNDFDQADRLMVHLPENAPV